MRGQNAIIRMRLEGYKPSQVWLFVLQTECSKKYWVDAENTIEMSGLPEIHIGIDEVVGALDLRVLTGVTVLLQGLDVDRLRAVFARIKEFSPERIITSTGDFVNDYYPKEALT